jgi:hypothetical protein
MVVSQDSSAPEYQRKVISRCTTFSIISLRRATLTELAEVARLSSPKSLG